MSPSPNLETELLTGIYSEEEKAQILGQIEEAASANRLTVDPGAFRPLKRGVLFPVLVNVAAVALCVGAWFGANAYFQTRQAGLQLKTDQMFSTESKLLAKVLEDSKAQLAAKNAEIDKINANLQKLAAEKDGLQKSFEQRVAAQGKTLRQQMADALAAEKARLQAAGYGEEEVARRLKEFELQKNAEFNDRLDVYRQQVQAEINQRTLAVTALETQLQTTIRDQAKIRTDIEKQTRERERALQTQLSAQAADLDQLKQDRDELNAFYRQTDLAMGAVRSAFETGDLPKTQAAVAALRQTLARASASVSETVRARAVAEANLVTSFDAAVSTLGASTSKAETTAQIEAVRAQAKKEQALAALQLAETQKTLTAVDAQWKQAQGKAEALRQDVDDLVARLDQSTGTAIEVRTENQALAAQVASLERQVEDLIPYRTRADALGALFAASYSSSRDRFLQTFGSEAGLAAFPGFPQAWKDLEGQTKSLDSAENARRQALEQILAFITYLQGTSPSATAVRTETERLTRTDETFQKVVTGIQTLAAEGATETAVKTNRTQLYGTVVAVSGTKVVLEPLTRVRPAEGDLVELRRVVGKKETLLGRGKVVAAADQRVEADWTGNTGVPLSGDAAYLVLPSAPSPDKVNP